MQYINGDVACGMYKHETDSWALQESNQVYKRSSI